MAISTLTVGISQERIRISSSRRLQRPKNLPFTPPVDERPAEKTASESHLDRLYRAAGVEPPNADDAEQVDAIGRSFLKLSNSDAGSIVSADRHSERSFEALRRFNAWAIPTAVTLLCGCIIAFMDLSPILPLCVRGYCGRSIDPRLHSFLPSQRLSADSHSHPDSLRQSSLQHAHHLKRFTSLNGMQFGLKRQHESRRPRQHLDRPQGHS